jgi:predicted methyltransferase
MAHRLVGERIEAGDVVVDATAGNGYDTEFLAGIVGKKGTIYAIDVQSAALRETKKRVKKSKFEGDLRLVERSHAELLDIVDEEHHGDIGALVFNLGYLPRGDKSVTTEWSSTLPALRGGLELLKHGGVLSAVCYPGHPAGAEEANAVARWAGMLDQVDFRAVCYRFENVVNDPPFLIGVEKV